MKKLVIALVCVGLLVALTIPTIYSASKWGTYTLTLSGDVEVEAVLEQCKASKRCISSGYISDLRLWLNPDSDKFGDKYGDWHDAEGIVLSENKDGEITMQFFFFDQKGKKVVLEVEGGDVIPGEWLSDNFTILFDDPDAVITSAKGKKILWEPENGGVNITIECTKEEP